MALDQNPPVAEQELEYFEVPVPSGDALCSDPECPCPEDVIPRGDGYVYVGPQVVEFRRDARSLDEASRKLDRLQNGGLVVFGPGIAAPILACRRGAELRKLDLDVAAEDARHWWATGMVPLRSTPLTETPVVTPPLASRPAPAPVAPAPPPPPAPPRQVPTAPVTLPLPPMPGQPWASVPGAPRTPPRTRKRGTVVLLPIVLVLVAAVALAWVISQRADRDGARPEALPRVEVTQGLTRADAVLDGRWEVEMRLESARGFQQVHAGRTLSPAWTFVARCTGGKCTGATLSGTSPGGSWTMKLERRGDTYVGETRSTMSYCGDAPLGTYQSQNAVRHTLTLRLEITDAEEIDGEWIATAFNAFLKDKAGPATGDALFGKVTCPASGYTATVSGAPA